MGIERLKLILYDAYQMDAWMPPAIYKRKDEFSKACYSRWALNELEEYIERRLHPRTDGTLREFCTYTREFMMKMAKMSKANRRTRPIFQSAYKVAADVLDLLRAMM